MVILSCGICNKNGKLLVSRQFDQPFTKTQIQDTYLSFPKLIHPNQQHTYVQSDKYTFLYIPIDQQIFLVLVSTKNSNIIEDQETIKLMYRLLGQICSEGITAESIEENCIDIILAMDDIISMGYRESVTIQQVIDELKMESAEEKAHIALLKQQQEEAKAANEKKNLQGGK